MTDAARLYDAHYFAHACGPPYRRDEHWLGFFGRIADRIVADIQPRSVLDAGCAMGFLVEALRERGVEAFGIDVSEYALDQVHPDARPYCRLASVTDPLPESYDLIVCIEVLEHLSAEDAEDAVDNICGHTEDVLFSSTPLDYEEPTHVNVQPPEHWAELFARRGFFRDVEYDASYVTAWAVRFRSSRDPVARIVAAYERRLWHLQQENQASREQLLKQRDELAREEEKTAEARRTADELAQALDERERALADAQRTIAEQEKAAAEASEWLRARERALAEATGQLEQRSEALAAARGDLAWITATRGWRMLNRYWKLKEILGRGGSRRA